MCSGWQGSTETERRAVHLRQLSFWSVNAGKFIIIIIIIIVIIIIIIIILLVYFITP